MVECIRCEEDKPITLFPKDRSRPTGHFPYCKTCTSKNTRTYHDKYRAQNQDGPTIENKLCPNCNIIKSKDKFKISRAFSGGLFTWCKECTSLFRKNDPKERSSRLEREYGISEQEYDLLLQAQNNKCAICYKAPSQYKLCIDHDHEAGHIRGLLCKPCNSGLGYFRDRPENIEEAKEYLNRNPPYIPAIRDDEHQSYKATTYDRNRRLVRKYGINLNQYNALVESQNSQCSICQKITKLHIDHCHENGIVRGLLCHSCNSGLGFLYEDHKLFDEAIRYLET